MKAVNKTLRRDIIYSTNDKIKFNTSCMCPNVEKVKMDMYKYRTIVLDINGVMYQSLIKYNWKKFK